MHPQIKLGCTASSYDTVHAAKTNLIRLFGTLLSFKYLIDKAEVLRGKWITFFAGTVGC